MTPNTKKNYICGLVLLFYSLFMYLLFNTGADHSADFLFIPSYVFVVILSLISLCIPIKAETKTVPKQVSFRKIVFCIFWVVAIPTLLLCCCSLIVR